VLRRGRLPLIPRHHATVVEDPDDPDIVSRLVPETGNTGTGGGAYLLLDACPRLQRRPALQGQCAGGGHHRTR
jgi:hypothetical protein